MPEAPYASIVKDTAVKIADILSLDDSYRDDDIGRIEGVLNETFEAINEAVKVFAKKIISRDREIERLKAENDLLHSEIKETGDLFPELQRYRKLFDEMEKYAKSHPMHDIMVQWDWDLNCWSAIRETASCIPEEYQSTESMLVALENALGFGEPEKTC